MSEALAHFPFVIRCGPSTYAPARLALDQKAAFRVGLTDGEVHRGRLSKQRLEPFFTALGRPIVQTEDGKELKTIYLAEAEAGDMRRVMMRVI